MQLSIYETLTKLKPVTEVREELKKYSKLKDLNFYTRIKILSREIDKFYLNSLQNKVNMIKFKHSILFGKPIIYPLR